MTWQSNLAIAGISALATTALTISHKYLTDQKRLKEIKEEIKRHQELLKTQVMRGTEKQARQKKILSLTKESAKIGMKGTLITILPVMILFGLIPIGLKQDWWLTTYITTSIITSLTTRKLLKIH